MSLNSFLFITAIKKSPVIAASFIPNERDCVPRRRSYRVAFTRVVDPADGEMFSPDGQMLLQSRGHYLTGGEREKHFNLFKQWAYSHAGTFWEVLSDRYVLYGEWLYAKLQGATSAPKARVQEGFTWQAPRQISSFLTMQRAGGARLVSSSKLCVVKKNGLISENKTAIKNATDILSSSTAKVSKSETIYKVNQDLRKSPFEPPSVGAHRHAPFLYVASLRKFW